MLGFHPTYNGVSVQLGLNWIASKHWRKTVEKLAKPGNGHEAIIMYFLRAASWDGLKFLV